MSAIIEYHQHQHQRGRLFVVGDIHGCYDELMAKLEAIHFDFQHDLLIAVGDLVDRGVDSLKCLELMDKPWFKAILGNHEEMCILSYGGDAMMQDMHSRHGGEWFYALSDDEQRDVVDYCMRLPLVLEVSHQNKRYGFVHADVRHNHWDLFKQELETSDPLQGRACREAALWGRSRVRNRPPERYKTIQGIDAVFLGHTVVDLVTKRNNCYFIDTGGVFGMLLTVLEIHPDVPIEKQVVVI